MTAVARATTQSVCEGLACPDAGDERLRERLLDVIEPTFARAAVMAFLATYEAELSDRAPGLRESIDRWLAGPLGFGDVWAPQRAELYAAQPDDPVRAAAAVGLHAAASGETGRWRATLRRPARLRMGDVLLPSARAVRVDAGGPGLGLRLALEPSTHAEFERLPRAGDDGPLLLAEEAVPPACTLSADVRALVVPRVTSDAASAFADALRALDAHPAGYARWVRRVVLEIVVLDVEGEGMRSGSSTSWPGLVYMSTEDPLTLADNLVHEASHQYLHVLGRMEPMDDGSDDALYPSPVAHRDRPLRAILVAYHAFANVALLLSGWQHAGLEDGGYCDARLGDVLPKLRILEGPLRDNPALTDAGRALFQPLAARLEPLL